MTLSQYRSSSSWLGAIELGPKLMNLAEELPASEEMGLSLQLRQLMVELPATVAADLVQGTDTRQAVAFRLLSTLELVDRVYPALDTAGLRADADSLVERLMSADQFAAGPEPVPVAPAPEVEPLDVPTLEPADTPVLATEVTEAADVAAPTTEVVAEVPVVTPAPIEPTSVPVSTEPTP